MTLFFYFLSNNNFFIFSIFFLFLSSLFQSLLYFLDSFFSFSFFLPFFLVKSRFLYYHKGRYIHNLIKLIFIIFSSLFIRQKIPRFSSLQFHFFELSLFDYFQFLLFTIQIENFFSPQKFFFFSLQYSILSSSFLFEFFSFEFFSSI